MMGGLEQAPFRLRAVVEIVEGVWHSDLDDKSEDIVENNGCAQLRIVLESGPA